MPVNSWWAGQQPWLFRRGRPPNVFLLDWVGLLSVLENIKLHFFKSFELRILFRDEMISLVDSVSEGMFNHGG